MLKIIIVFAELERKTTAERTLSTMQDRTARGLWNGGVVYGYLSDPDDPGKLIVDPEWSKIIQRHFFDAFEELGSAGAVQRHLRKIGVRIPQTQSKFGGERGGKPFARQQITRVLKNRIYLGELHWGQVECRDSHQPIIDQRQFDRVQRRLDQTNRTKTNSRQAHGRCYILRGLVQCGCGAMMTPKSANGKGGKYHYYTCTQQNHFGVKTDCSAPAIPAESLEEAILDRVVSIGVDVGDRQRIVEAALSEIDDESRKLESRIEIARHRLTRIQTEIRNLVQVLKHAGAEGITSIGDELKELEGERSRLQTEIKTMTEQESPVGQLQRTGQKFIENWGDIGGILREAEPEEQRSILHHFIQSLVLTFANPEEKRADYSLRLFPEVRATDFLSENGFGNGSENEKGTVPETDNGPRLLTPEAKVRRVGEKAPRVGLEPTTYGLTVRRSTD